MELSAYRKVIAGTIARFGGLDPDELAGKILERVEMAMEIAGDVPVEAAPPPAVAVSYRTKERPAPKLVLPETEGGIIIGEAPPSPILSGMKGEGEPEIEYWQVTDLRDALSRELPASIRIKVPGVPDPIELVRYFELPPQVEFKPGVVGYAMKWVKACYRIGGQSLGPGVIIPTTVKEFDRDQILSDISSQAAAWYRKEVPVLRGIVPPAQAPNLDEMMKQSIARGDANAPISPEAYTDAAALQRDVLSKRGIRSLEDWKPDPNKPI